MQWTLITEKFLKNPPTWFYHEMWIAKSKCEADIGYGGWEQGHLPDRLILDGCNLSALDGYYVMPLIKPTPPDL